MYNPDLHHRKSIRLDGYDYTREGYYFITVCTHKHLHQFGEILDGFMVLNDVGHLVIDEWKKTETIRDNVILDEWVVMPNHFHAVIRTNPDCRGTARRAPTTNELFGQPVSGSISTIVRSFKSAVTKRFHEIPGNENMQLWQRNFWEHIIRDEESLFNIRKYIEENPARWESDKMNEFGID
ncbi:MAG: transposase [Deltaproteobacteria bacterium]|nr:transposase [Deltaproteobacteria bacterium]